MAEAIVENLFAPQGGWKVRILDLSDGGTTPEDEAVVEDVPGFLTLMQAQEFARRYVRDSVERCRTPGADAHTVAGLWRSFGEDAYVLDSGDTVWRAESELMDFAAQKASRDERNWRALDPRGDMAVQDDDDDTDASLDGLDHDDDDYDDEDGN